MIHTHTDCSKAVKIFCLELPEHCPTCGTPVMTGDLQHPPVQVPYPFINSSRAPCSVVIRPTDGDFLQ